MPDRPRREAPEWLFIAGILLALIPALAALITAVATEFTPVIPTTTEVRAGSVSMAAGLLIVLGCAVLDWLAWRHD